MLKLLEFFFFLSHTCIEISFCNSESDNWTQKSIAKRVEDEKNVIISILSNSINISRTLSKCCFVFQHHFVLPVLRDLLLICCRKAENFVTTFMDCLDSDDQDIVTSALKSLADFTALCQGKDCKHNIFFLLNLNY